MKEILTADQMPYTPGEVVEVNTRDKKLNKLMRDTIVELKNIIREKNLDGLTACQIGINERIMVLKFGDNELQSYINPVVTSMDGFCLNRETCINLNDGKTYLVPRNQKIVMVYETPLGAIQQATFVGKAAHVVQHLIWHMDGLFIDEVGLELPDDWDTLSDEDQEEILKEYYESIDIAKAQINDEINNSEEALKLKNAIEFEQAVNKGEIKLRNEKFKIISTSEEKEENIDESNSVQEGNESTGE